MNAQDRYDLMYRLGRESLHLQLLDVDREKDFLVWLETEQIDDDLIAWTRGRLSTVPDGE